MKSLRTIPLLTVAVLAIAHADDTPPETRAPADPFAKEAFKVAMEGPSNVQIDVEFIEVSEPIVTGLLHGPEAPQSGSEWRKAAEKLIQETKAKVAGSVTVTTKPGQRSRAESAKELPYPTEFDPAKGRAEHAPNVPKSLTGSDVPTPTAFEMRAVGIRVEAEPIISAGSQTIDLNVDAELTEKVDEAVHQQIPLGDKQMQATIKQPVFHTMKATCSVAVANGSSALAGILIPHNEKGDNDPNRRILCLLTARLVGM